MSHIPRLTLIGMYNYDANLFNDVTFPTGIDKTLAVNSLLLKYGEKPVLYMDVTFMKFAMKTWADKWYSAFENINEALTAEYNKIHNFDRNEEYTDKTKDVGAYVGKDVGATANDNTQTDTRGTENKVSAFNSSTYEPNTKAENSGTLVDSGTGSSQIDRTSSDQRDIKFEHIGHLYGNIGITTSQQMIGEELKLRKDANIYDIIAEIFSRELLLYTY